jgi:CHAT domain-containing protein
VYYRYCKAIICIEKNAFFDAEPFFEAYVKQINPVMDNAETKVFHKNAYLWIGEINKAKGQYQATIAAYQNSLLFDTIAYSKAATQKLIGDTYALQYDWENALISYKKSISRLKNYYPQAKMPQDKIETEKRLIRGYEAIANYFRFQNRLDSAKYYLDLRRPLLKINTESNMVDSHLFDALLLSELGKYQSATTFYNKALALAKKQNDIRKIAEIYRNRAEVFLKQKAFQKAIIDVDSALISLPQKTNIVYKKDYLQCLSVKTEAMINLYRVDNQLDVNQLKTIFSLLNQTSLLTDSVTTDYNNFRDKQTLLSLQRSAFRNGIWAAAQLFEQTNDATYVEKAFQWSEQSRSATLRSISQLDQIRTFAGVPDSVIRKDDALRQKIAALETTIRLGGNLGESQQISFALQDVKAKHEDFLKDLEEKYPDYFKLKYQYNSLTISEMKSKLPSKRCVLEFFINQNDCYTFLLTPKGLEMKKLTISEDSIITKVRQILAYVKGEKDNKAQYQTAAFELYQSLIAPFSSQLSTDVMIIPDGALSSLPFEVLLTESTKSTQGVGTLPYWIKQHSVSYHYAASLLFEEKKSKRQGNDWAVFAPSFAEEPDFQDKSQMAFFEKNVTETQIFKEKQATKANFLAKMSDCQILHINTHGIANDSVGDLSYLLLSDDKFYSAELYATKINADLVTLSACQTANGEFRHGEGTIGLTLGFLYAGAKSVVSSLWNVNQQSTGAFMQQFYQRFLHQKKSNIDALREAKLAIIAENPAYAHPKYWAPFVLVGDSEIVLEKGEWVWWIGIAGLALLFIKKMKKLG